MQLSFLYLKQRLPFMACNFALSLGYTEVYSTPKLSVCQKRLSGGDEGRQEELCETYELVSRLLKGRARD